MRIVLSGSSKVKESVFEIAKKLENMGHEVIVPKEFYVHMEKKEHSMLHFNEICKKETDILLAVNVTKNGIENYIGPNTFAEIAMGFYKQKKVYVLNDLYEPYLDELKGWGVIPLKGQLDKIGKQKIILTKTLKGTTIIVLGKIFKRGDGFAKNI